MEMECTISIKDKVVKKYLGDISPADWSIFCRDAIVSKLFEAQFRHTVKATCGEPRVVDSDNNEIETEVE